MLVYSSNTYITDMLSHHEIDEVTFGVHANFITELI